MSKKLKKSNKSKMIAGVCGGIAEYFKIDPTIVRLIFVVLGFIHGSGFLIYVIAAIVMPSDFENLENTSDDDLNNMKSANINSEEERKSENLHSDEDFEKFFKKD